MSRASFASLVFARSMVFQGPFTERRCCLVVHMKEDARLLNFLCLNLFEGIRSVFQAMDPF